MSDAKCCGRVWVGYDHYACGKKARVERGGKPYCGIHDPVRLAEKRAATDARWLAEREAKAAASKAERDKQDALERNAARYLWLRDVGDATWRPFGLREGYSAEQADAAIDAAMGQSKASEPASNVENAGASFTARSDEQVPDWDQQ